MTSVVETNSAIASEVIASTEGIVLVDFTAGWCPPCRMLAPILDQVAGESGDLTVLKVDVDHSPELASTYRVMSIPTLIFFVDGQPLRRLVGARGVASLREEISQVRVAAARESRAQPGR